MKFLSNACIGVLKIAANLNDMKKLSWINAIGAKIHNRTLSKYLHGCSGVWTRDVSHGNSSNKYKFHNDISKHEGTGGEQFKLNPQHCDL